MSENRAYSIGLKLLVIVGAVLGLWLLAAWLLAPGTSAATMAPAPFQSPLLSVEKAADPNPVRGVPYTYTLTVSNSGDVTATGVVVTDLLPSELSWVSGGTLMAGDVVSVPVGTVPATDTASATFVVSTCQASVVNEYYRVAYSEQGITSDFGPAVTTTLGTDLLAAFSMDRSTIPVNGSVSFSDESTGTGIDAWHWDFGDGGDSAIQSPSHQYTAPGIYTVTLTITGVCDISVSATDWVLVMEPAFQISKRSPGGFVRGDDVTYTLSVTNTSIVTATGLVVTDALPVGTGYLGGDGTLVGGDTVSWTIPTLVAGDRVDLHFTVSNTCQSPLENVWYRVASSDQGVGSPWGPMLTTPISVELVADFEQSSVPVMPGETVHFTDTSTSETAVPIVGWHWDFGDGITSTLQNPSHSYAMTDTYTVVLTVWDACGVTDTATSQVAVASAAFGISKEASGPLTYGEALTYTVTVTNTGNLTDTGIVVTDALPSGSDYLAGGGSFNGSVVEWTIPTLAVGAQDEVSFTVRACSASLTNEWYRVITSDLGVTGLWGDPLVTAIAQQTVTASFDQSATVVLLGQSVLFTDTTTPSDLIMGWHWDFAGEATSAAQNASHAFLAVGTRVVTLTVTDVCSNTYVVTGTVDVQGPELIIQKVAAADAVRGAPFEYTLSVWNNGPLTTTNVVVTDAVPVGATYVDGGAESGGVVSWTIAEIGPGDVGQVTFRVSTCQESLVNAQYRAASSDQGVGSGWGPVLTTSLASDVNADFTPQTAGIAVNGVVDFIDSSSGALAWGWDFGDGGTSAAQNPTHQYTAVGTYTVTLVITGACGVTDTAMGYVAVGAPGLAVGKEATGEFVRGGEVTYTLTITNYGPMTATNVVVTDAVPTGAVYQAGGTETGGVVRWTVPALPAGTQGVVGWFRVANPCESPLANEWYRAATSDQGVGSPWGPAVVTAIPVGLSASFDQSATAVHAGEGIQFTDTSSVESGLTIDEWYWEFGDGGTSVEQNPVYTYTTAGNYTVTLVVTDSCGVTATAQQAGAVAVDSSAYEISKAAAGTLVRGAPLMYTLTVTNVGNGAGSDIEVRDVLPVGASYVAGGMESGGAVEWTIPALGVGATEQVTFVVRSCQAEVVNERYRVETTAEGVTGSWGDVVTVTQEALAAAFSPSTAAIGAGDSVSFMDLSTPAGSIVSWEWAFGDGGTSGEQNPVYTYTTAGWYTVILTVTDGCGWTDVATGTVAVDSSLFEVSKAASGALTYGEALTYTVTVTNVGNAGDANVVVDDALPSGADYLSGGDSFDGSVVERTIPTLGAGAQGDVAFSVRACEATLVNDDYGVVTSSLGVMGPRGEALTTTIAPQAVTPSFDQSADTVDLGGSVTFTDTTTPTHLIVQRYWQFGDGGDAFGPTAVYTFSAAGTYTVTLTVIDVCSNTYWVSSTVTVEKEPVVYLPLLLRPATVYLPLGLRD